MPPAPEIRVPSLNRCPVTGLPIIHSPRWVVVFGGPKPYRAEFSLIGGNILHAAIDGSSTLEISRSYLDLLDSICAETLPANGKMILMEDYSGHQGATGESRNYYINRQKKNPRMAASIYFGTSALFATMIRVAKVFARVPFPVEIASDYSAAIGLARSIQERLSALPAGQGAAAPATGRRWSLETGAFAVNFELLPGNVLLSRPTGTLTTAEEVQAFSDTYHRILKEWSPPRWNYYRLMDWSALKHVSWKARGLYMQEMRLLQKEYPCAMAVLYGLGPFARAVYNASRHFLPIPIVAAKDREEGLEMIRKHAAVAPAATPEIKAPDKGTLAADEVNRQIHLLIDHMAVINWEQSGMEISEAALEKAGPFRPLYEALFVLKHDYDEIMQKQSEAESRRLEMEEKLRHSEKMQTIGTLAGGIAHDFNNMLGGITGFASLLRKKFGSLDPGIDRYAGMILDTGKRAGALIEGLLTFARKGRQETAPVAVHETIQNLTALLSHTINKNIKVALKLDAPDPRVPGDRAQVQNSLLNLAVNAADAMPGGGTLTIATRMVILDPEAVNALVYPIPPGEYLEITVSDTGTGIPPEIRGRIFEPFFTTKETGRGTGLGLASVYGAVQGHAGGIALESEPGKGTAFHLYFKTVVAAPETAGSALSAGPAGGSGRILAVDDEEVLRGMVREMLSELGYEAVLCADGQEAVERFAKGPGDFRAVILDMIMPRMAGEECFMRLRAIDPDVRIILSTGYSGHTRIAELLEKGAAGFLPKPYSLEALSEILQKVLKS